MRFGAIVMEPHPTDYLVQVLLRWKLLPLPPPPPRLNKNSSYTLPPMPPFQADIHKARCIIKSIFIIIISHSQRYNLHRKNSSSSCTLYYYSVFYQDDDIIRYTGRRRQYVATLIERGGRRCKHITIACQS